MLSLTHPYPQLQEEDAPLDLSYKSGDILSSDMRVKI